MQKTTFLVSGICCGSEAALIYRILQPLQGIDDVSVNVLVKTVTVIHDPTLVTTTQIVDVLNKAKFKAEVRELGQNANKKKSPWPSLNILICGVLMIMAMLSWIYPPMIWVALPSIGFGIPGMLLRSIAALKRCMLDINVLMLIAVFGAIGLGDYLEGASIVFLFTLAEWLEEKSTHKARTSLESLMNLAPRTAVIASTGQIVDVKDLMLGIVILVKAGECIPVDGLVVFGRGSVDESSLTGEFLPVDKEIDSKVWAGTLLLTGFINVLTGALPEDSAVAKMVKLVEDAQNRRSNMEEFIEKFAKYYTPGVVLIAACFALIPWALGVHDLRKWMYQSLVLLVVACPCALVISTPVAKVCGLSAAAKMGLIVKGGNYMEVLAKIKAMAFDKTGTLTEGAFTVMDMQCVDQQFENNQMLYWISSLENLSSHPMAKALVEYVMLRGIQPSGEVSDFKMIPGEGICGFVDGNFIQIGNLQLACRNGWITQSDTQKVHGGVSIGFIGVDSRYIGYYTLGDLVRREAAQAVKELQKQGIQVTVLTGDSKEAAELIQKQIGEEIKVEASLAPEDKMKKIVELKKKWGLTAMIGDGINDAPALAAADLGIAMGVAGSAVATETADVALMSNNLLKIPEAVKLAKCSVRKIYQNVALSLAVKLLFFGLTFAGAPSLWAAVVADMGTSIAVIFNSMLLLRKVGKDGIAAEGAPTNEQKISISCSLNSESRKALPREVDGLQEPLLSTSSCCKGCHAKTPPLQGAQFPVDDCNV